MYKDSVLSTSDVSYLLRNQFLFLPAAVAASKNHNSHTNIKSRASVKAAATSSFEYFHHFKNHFSIDIVIAPFKSNTDSLVHQPILTEVTLDAKTFVFLQTWFALSSILRVILVRPFLNPIFATATVAYIRRDGVAVWPVHEFKFCNSSRGKWWGLNQHFDCLSACLFPIGSSNAMRWDDIQSTRPPPLVLS